MIPNVIKHDLPSINKYLNSRVQENYLTKEIRKGEICDTRIPKGIMASSI